MTKEEILSKFNELKKLNISKSNLNGWIKKHCPELYKEIEKRTAKLNKFKVCKHNTTKLLDISIFERIYCIEHGLDDRPKCQTCGKGYVRFIKQANEYSKWCSISCSAKDPETIKKSELTRLGRHGSKTYSGQDKARQTRLAKNNGKWHSADFIAKAKAAKLEHYGNENYVNAEKAKATKLERYGNENYINYEKICETKAKAYGDQFFNNRDKFKATVNSFDEAKKRIIKAKRSATNIERYGVEFATQSQKVKGQTAKTNQQKYGCSSTLMLSTSKSALQLSHKEKSWKHILADKDYAPMFTFDEFKDSSTNKVWLWKCNKCGNVFEALYDNGHHHRCFNCYPNTANGTSMMEQKVAEYVQSLTKHKVYNRSLENKRLIPHREVDIYVPGLKLGIEFDGLYYHSEQNGKDKSYHLEKTELCEQKGIQLIHIFEDEWCEKQKIVKSRLKHIICKQKLHRIFARKCAVREIDNVTKDKFLEKYHIQGKDIAKIRFGLFYNSHLVAVMTFAKSRFNKKYQYELSRYATIANFTIVGGAGKLLKCFEQAFKPKSIVTYADRRWSKGNLYYNIGFRYLHSSAPNYFYIKNQHRFSRLLFQKHKLKNLLEKFDESKTEVENMLDNGYYRIFDCGNLVFVKEYDK